MEQESDNTQQSGTLQKGTLLKDYRIISPIRRSAYSITYRAEDTINNRTVLLEENFPGTPPTERTEEGVRVIHPEDAEEFDQILSAFENKAKILASLWHSNLPKVICTFRHGGTAYYVSPEEKGTPLLQAVPAAYEIEQTRLSAILIPLLRALSQLHSKGILHGRITPSNILFTEEQTPLLINLSTLSDYGQLGEDDDRTRILPDEYVPIEQLTAGTGPWSDLYALAAICYRLITGSNVPDCLERSSQETDPYKWLTEMPHLRQRFSFDFLAAIDCALAFQPKKRFQSADEWIAAIGEANKNYTRQHTRIDRQQPEAHDSTCAIKDGICYIALTLATFILPLFLYCSYRSHILHLPSGLGKIAEPGWLCLFFLSLILMTSSLYIPRRKSVRTALSGIGGAVYGFICISALLYIRDTTATSYLQHLQSYLNESTLFVLIGTFSAAFYAIRCATPR